MYDANKELFSGIDLTEEEFQTLFSRVNALIERYEKGGLNNDHKMKCDICGEAFSMDSKKKNHMTLSYKKPTVVQLGGRSIYEEENRESYDICPGCSLQIRNFIDGKKEEKNHDQN